jgi:hypothetical protein
MTSSSLPNINLEGITTFTKLFDRQSNSQIAYKANDIDSVIGYFLKRGFEEVAAINTALIILQQAATDKVPVHRLLDTLKGVSDVELSQIVAQILNNNRPKTSQIGYRFEETAQRFDERNIIINEKPVSSVIEDDEYTRYGYVKEGYVE